MLGCFAHFLLSASQEHRIGLNRIDHQRALNEGRLWLEAALNHTLRESWFLRWVANLLEMLLLARMCQPCAVVKKDSCLCRGFLTNIAAWARLESSPFEIGDAPEQFRSRHV